LKTLRKYSKINNIIIFRKGKIMAKQEKKFEDYFKIVKHKLPYWEELPEIDLYMDQVIVLMEKYLSFHKSDEDTKIITSSMINNYVKLGIMPAPVKKKYSREHIAYLIIICCLKQALPISDIKGLIESRVKRTSIAETLNFFSDLYDSVFNTVIAIGKKYSNRIFESDELFTDTALFMSIGSNASKYIASEIMELNKKDSENK
jgi:DNA-binding transcriptional MerR regulator